MIKKLTLLVIAGAISAFAQNPVVNSATYSDLSHSSMLVHMQISSAWQNVRIRYIPTAQGSCTSGTGGTVQPSAYPGYGGATYRPLNFQIILSGLTADTQYQICPEVANIGASYDGSGAWSSGIGFTVRTLPLPAVHPALPVAAVEYKPVLPDMTNYHVVTLDSACYVASGGPVGQYLGDAIGDAANRQAEYGTHIIAPHGANCTQLAQVNTDSENVTHFNPSQVNMADNSITFTPSQISQMMGSDQINEGQQFTFSAYYGGLPGSASQWPTIDPPASCTGLIPGVVYYAHLPNPADHTKIQISCAAPFGQSSADGTASKLMVFANPGGGSYFKVQRYPTTLNWIVLDTDIPDSQFAPVGTRVSPQWASKMPRMTHIYKGVGTPSGVGNVPGSGGVVPIQLNLQSNDGNEQRTISNVWIRRWEFTEGDDLDSDTSTDPLWYRSQLNTSQNSKDIVFDQVYIHGLGAPHRTWRPISSFDGHNMALINSHISDLDMFQSDMQGLAIQQLSSTSFKISSGTHGLNGLHLYSQPGDITVNMTAGTNGGSVMVYASLDGTKLNVSLPPGVSGSCTGGPCNIFTSYDRPSGMGNGVFDNGGTSAYPNTIGGYSLYWVDPLFNTTSSQTGAISLLANVMDPSRADLTAAPVWYPQAVELGVRFQSDVNGYISGIRFYKDSRDSNLTHAISLWDSTGHKIASATTVTESGQGWQTAVFAAPVAIQANTIYTASYFSSAGGLYADNFYQNQNVINGHLSALASYAASSGGCWSGDNWPKNWAGRTSVGIVACVTLNSGSISNIQRADARTSTFGEVNSQSGCNCFIAGIGPGPWLIQNNFLSTTGNGFHHDEGGIAGDHYRAGTRDGTAFWVRGDYLYRRNYFEVPLSHMSSQPPPTDPTRNPDYDSAYDPTLYALSNHLYYQHRQPFEFKSGHRINVDGNVFSGGFTNTASSIFVAMTSVCDEGIQDASYTNNTFQHGPGVLVAMSSTAGGCMQTPPPKRFLFRNNLAWDIRQSYFAPGGPQNPGAGWLFEAIGSEDATVLHNTVFFNHGRASALAYLFDQKTEGVKIKDNIFFMSAGSGGAGIRQESGSTFFSGPNACGQVASGQAFADCELPGNDISNNLFFSDSPKATVQSWWSNGKNYIPDDPTDQRAARWFNLSSAWDNGVATAYTPYASPFAKPDFHLRSDSQFISGGAVRASDGSSLGADIDALDAAQGKVTLIGVGNGSISASSATVSFVAPDAQGCPVDFSSTDPTLVSNFTRVSDAGGNTVRNIALTSLSPHTTYYYRVNCAVQQPTGLFRTK
ncbi:MAG: DUF4082 domain-containing protein [Bryobacteraceae bacterium]